MDSLQISQSDHPSPSTRCSGCAAHENHIPGWHLAQPLLSHSSHSVSVVDVMVLGERFVVGYDRDCDVNAGNRASNYYPLGEGNPNQLKVARQRYETYAEAQRSDGQSSKDVHRLNMYGVVPSWFE